MNLVKIDMPNSTIIIFNLISLCWCKRGGMAFDLSRTCGHDDISIHMTGWYLQVFNYGGHIMWASKKCWN